LNVAKNPFLPTITPEKTMQNKALTSLISLPLLFSTQYLCAQQNETRYNQISFNASAETEVANDLLVVTMQSQDSGEDLQQLADQVNKNMSWAIEQAKKHERIQYQTLNYSTTPRYEKGRQAGWQVSQSLKISGTDAADIAKLMGRLQQKLQTQSVNYQVTPEAREAAEKTLTASALEKFTAKAGEISKSLNMGSYKLVSLSVNGSNEPQPRPMFAMSRMVAAEAAMAPPAIEAGSQTVTVSVSGTIELQP
jgi:predicted secreted protein